MFDAPNFPIHQDALSQVLDLLHLRGEFQFDSVVAERILSAMPQAITLRPPDGKPFPWVEI